ncbi:MAG TPA: tripartite tricarboxylate transporter substrate-binding protein [Gemmatimonadaceae bacterium]|nr:tripartite tricarboxylate transporter substrate-binding protein [Gemmatimonadaceae bacterium]
MLRSILLCLLAALASLAQAQPKITRIVVPFAAGGAREVLARTFYSELGAALGETIIIDNKPGAGGAIGTSFVAHAAPDGRTLIFAASSHNLTALLGATPAYDPIADFAAAANIGMQSYALMISASIPAKTAAEFLAYARANPGKLNYSSAGHGSSTHVAMAYFVSLAGLSMVHIPFKSSQDAVNDVLAARSHAVIVPNVGAIPFAKDARLRIVGVTSLGPSPFLPGVPPLAASVRGYEFDSWFGLLAPARTPKPVIQRINAEVAKLLRDPAILKRLAGQGVVPRALSPEAFERLIREDYEETATMVKAVGKIE